jgi:hypothetical protein
MTDPNPALAALLASGRRELAKHRVTHLHKPKPTPPEDTAVINAAEPQPPMPAEGAPHAYVAVQRTHSVNADRPEWNDDATVIPAWDTERIEEHRRHAQHHDCTLLPIGPDGDTGTRAIVEPRGFVELVDPDKLDLLPRGSAVLTRNGRVWQKAFNAMVTEWCPAQRLWDRPLTSAELLGLGPVAVIHIATPAEVSS